MFESRLGLVTRQLARSPYLAGGTFTATDISVTWQMMHIEREVAISLLEAGLRECRGRHLQASL